MNNNTNNTVSAVAVPSTTLSIIDRKAVFFGGTSLWKVRITGTEPGKFWNSSAIDMTKAVLNAVNHLYVGTFPVHVVGLHLKKSWDELNIIGAADDCGYVRSCYAGDVKIENFERLAAEGGVGIVSFRDGRLRLSRIAHNVEFSMEENDDVTHDRATFNLAVALDLLAAGYEITLEPHMASTTNRDGVVTSGKTHVNMMLMTRLNNLNLSIPDAKEAMFRGIAKKTTRMSMGKAFAEKLTATENGEEMDVDLVEVGVIVDLENFTIERKPVSILKNAIGFLFSGRYAVSPEMNLDDVAIFKTIKERNLLVYVPAIAVE